MAKAVHRDEHKMHAFVRFREIGREQKSHFVAWFEPEHHIVELAAPFFASRFADMPWSILTPDVCAHWDGHAVSFTPGVAKAEAPTEDRLEETWRRYYATIFNPARLKVKAIQKRCRKNTDGTKRFIRCLKVPATYVKYRPTRPRIFETNPEGNTFCECRGVM